MKWLILWMLVFVYPVAQAATFKYQAYIGGVRAGHATINVDWNQDSYTVSGSARAEGLVKVLGSWHTRFVATGRFVAGIAELIEFIGGGTIAPLIPSRARSPCDSPAR